MTIPQRTKHSEKKEEKDETACRQENPAQRRAKKDSRVGDRGREATDRFLPLCWFFEMTDQGIDDEV